MKKKNIALVTGGYSSESVISVQSAEQLSEMIDKERYEVYIISIEKDKWIGKGGAIEGIPVDKNDFSLTVNSRKIRFDCVFISIHGTPGEDGKLQSYFDMLQIPYTSSDVCSSSLTFNKFISKNYLKYYNIPSATTLLIRPGDRVDPDDLIRQTGLPCFIKPNESGSSFGISRISDINQMEQAIANARQEDDEILIEEYLEGREITCGLVDTQNGMYIFPVTEVVSKKDFFDYEAKYTAGMANEITPAPIPESMRQKCQQLSERIYRIFNCSGIVRIDYIIRNNELYFLEVNSVPGMSKNSIIPQQIRAMGYSPTEMFTTVIEESINK